MSERIYLAFDVGGTSIKAGAIEASGHIVEESLSYYESKANEGADQIVDHFVRMADELSGLADPDGRKPIAGVGYAFPGPFDYENGISYIQGLNKFEALYGLRFGERLLQGLRSNSRLAARLHPELCVRFENDAALFAIGEAHYGEATRYRRAVCLTLGTGIGSGFIEDGRLIKQRDDIPDNGWVYHLPYRGSIADDYISRRGLLELARELGIDVKVRDVKQLAEAAFSGDAASLLLFDMFGKRMADALETTLKAFAPDLVVLGGQISKSGELFIPSFQRELLIRGLDVYVRMSRDTLRSTLLGIYHLLQQESDED